MLKKITFLNEQTIMNIVQMKIILLLNTIHLH